MRSRKISVCCTLAALALAGCSGDLVSPAGPEAPARTVSAASVLSVTLSGQQYIQPFDNCTWHASVTGGTPPYSYAWNGSGMGGGTSYGSYWTGYATGAGQYRVDVQVTDAVGRTASAVMRGTSTYSAHLCFQM